MIGSREFLNGWTTIPAMFGGFGLDGTDSGDDVVRGVHLTVDGPGTTKNRQKLTRKKAIGREWRTQPGGGQ